MVSADVCNCGYYINCYTALKYRILVSKLLLARTQINSLDSTNISHSVTLVPRLGYSVTLLDEIICVLAKKQNDLKKSNKSIIMDFDETDKTHLEAIKFERIIVFSLQVLSKTKKRIKMISSINNIPEIIPTLIPMIRTVSAQLFEIMPTSSQKLSELSVHLGSIVLDSATLTHARFDLSLSNEESTVLLDKVKLMVDSKISKQYPNLDFLKICNT